MKKKREEMGYPYWSLMGVWNDRQGEVVGPKIRKTRYSSVRVKDVSEIVEDMLEYFDIAYYEGRLCTKEQAEKLCKSIEENTKAK